MLSFRTLLRMLRVKQWTKNAVVFAAFGFALGDQMQSLSFSMLWTVCLAALAFCGISSGVYVFNDIVDVEKDRQHPKKKFRPIAAGDVSIPVAYGLAVFLWVLCLGGGYLLQPAFAGVLSAYLLMQIAYTLVLKKVALVDVFIIAVGFVLRALGGAVVIQVPISPWLLLCTLLLALFLGLCKRRHEKVQLSGMGDSTRASLEGYSEKLLDQLISIVSSATLVTYAIYTFWPDTVAKFGTHWLGLTIPFVIFGLFRYLDLVYRSEKGDQPEQILLTDVPLMIDIVLFGATALGVVLFSR